MSSNPTIESLKEQLLNTKKLLKEADDKLRQRILDIEQEKAEFEKILNLINQLTTPSK